MPSKNDFTRFEISPRHKNKTTIVAAIMACETGRPFSNGGGSDRKNTPGSIRKIAATGSGGSNAFQRGSAGVALASLSTVGVTAAAIPRFELNVKTAAAVPKPHSS